MWESPRSQEQSGTSKGGKVWDETATREELNADEMESTMVSCLDADLQQIEDGIFKDSRVSFDADTMGLTTMVSSYDGLQQMKGGTSKDSRLQYEEGSVLEPCLDADTMGLTTMVSSYDGLQQMKGGTSKDSRLQYEEGSVLEPCLDADTMGSTTMSSLDADLQQIKGDRKASRVKRDSKTKPDEIHVPAHAETGPITGHKLQISTSVPQIRNSEISPHMAALNRLKASVDSEKSPSSQDELRLSGSLDLDKLHKIEREIVNFKRQLRESSDHEQAKEGIGS